MLNIQELMLTYSGVYATFGLYRGAFAPNNSLVFGQIPDNQPGQAGTDSPYQLAWTNSSQQAVKQTESHFILLVYSNFFVPYLGVYAEYLGAYANIQELMLNIQELMLTYSGVYATCGLSRGAFAPNNCLGLGLIPDNQPSQAGNDSPSQLAWSISSKQAVPKTETHLI